MINKPTVLILGAGASQPYGFPTGEELRSEICKRLSDEKDLVTRIVCEKKSLSDISSFVTALRLSRQYSMDAFLAQRSEYELIGKLALAAVLLIRQSKSEPTFDADLSWYQRLFNALIDNCPDIETFSNNRLTIITYNYDRSLEHYLFLSLKHTFGLPDKAAAKSVGNLNIVHMHGHVGKVDWEGAQERYNIFDYDGAVNSWAIRHASSDVELKRARELTLLHRSASKAVDSIKVIHEVDASKLPEFMQARAALSRAQNIYFLGFGYHELNLERLGHAYWAEVVKCKGTAYKLDAQTKNRLSSLRIGDNDIKLNLHNGDCYDFLYNEVVLE